MAIFNLRNGIGWGMTAGEVMQAEGRADVVRNERFPTLTTLSYKDKGVSRFTGELRYAFYEDRLFLACYRLSYDSVDLDDIAKYLYLKRAMLCKYGQNVPLSGEDGELLNGMLCAIDGLFPDVMEGSLVWAPEEGTRIIMIRAIGALWIVYLQSDISAGMTSGENNYDTSGL